MTTAGITEGLRFFSNRIRERLWVKPLVISVLSIAAAFAAKAADSTNLSHVVPLISSAVLDTLLSIMASSMLVIATFAVASMVSAYSSASNTASPRSFPLVIIDDVSQRALSIFIGAFIFSIVGLITFKSGFFEAAGRFVLFLFTVAVFGMVILTFVHWVDRIARLGRMGNTIDKVEGATAAALQRRRDAPALNGIPAESGHISGQPVFAESVGYVQRIDIAALQSRAQDFGGRIRVVVLPGTFVAPGRALAYIGAESRTGTDFDCTHLANAFLIGKERRFDDDPRYGLIVLSQIADRALSPAVNDPGTAIDVIARLVRLFVLWGSPAEGGRSPEAQYDRVEVPELSAREMFDDAFAAIGRDGSHAVEVAIRLEKALASLASICDAAMRDAAVHQARRALAFAEKALTLPEDRARVREAASFALDHSASE
ncbi:MAG: DUF2254 domain-containing protein [Proteobacteria bacterium]|nr:DUF2254 domain-containing protein [Pseudomonadota bacterium]